MANNGAWFGPAVVAACLGAVACHASRSSPGESGDMERVQMREPKAGAPTTPTEPTGAGAPADPPARPDPVDGEPQEPEAACRALELAFYTFVEENLDCARDDDCAVVGDCGPNADFRAVRRAVAEEAYALMRARCTGPFDGPMFHATCNAGECVLVERTDTCCGCPSAEDDAGI